MRFTRRHLLLSALAFRAGPPTRGSTRVAPAPTPDDAAVAASGLAALAVRFAPADWRGVFAGTTATGVAGGPAAG